MESDSTEHGFDVVELMREKLPSYIVNRFLAAGYDSKEIITSMDVTNRKGNSIGEIEKYIERSFSDDETMRSPFPSPKHPYEFPPGHRIRICNFVQEVKKKCRHTVSLTTGQDYNPPKSKQHKNVPSKSTLAKPVESKPDGESNDSMDADSILIQVQDSINKWVQCQVKDKLKNICENKHYSIRVGDSANVYVACLLCDKTIKLQQKNNGTYQTSNWFKHIKRCIEIKRPHQPKLKFSSKLSSTPLKSSSKDHDMSSSKDDKLLEIPATQVTCTTNLSSDERKKSSMLMEDIASTAVTADGVERNTNVLGDSLSSTSSTEDPESKNTGTLDGNESSNTVFQQSPSLDNKGGAGLKYPQSGNVKHTSPIIQCYKDVLTCNSEDSKKGQGKDWSRHARLQRKLELAAKDPSQTNITDYYKIIDDIEKLMQKNKNLTTLLQQHSMDSESPFISSLTPVLRQIVLNAETNSQKYPKQRRHSEIIMKFSTALFIYCGPLSYEFIQQNMQEALPSLRTVQRLIHREYKTLDEGKFRFDELLSHINQHKALQVVSISEDATRVIRRVDYDSETDRCVGFVLPVAENGLPLIDSFLAVSFSAIEDMFKHFPISKYAYVYMAQPLGQSIPPFCLACLGSDNKFDADHVILRWKFIYTECRKRSIDVLSFGGDGDTRILKAMKVSTLLSTTTANSLYQHVPSCSKNAPDVPQAWNSWFFTTPVSAISYVQDVIHIATKLKSRLLKPSIILPLGPNYLANGHHIQMIRQKFQKDQHGLRERDVNHKDRQNFDAVMHIISASHLLDDIPGANGTKVYVDIIQHTVESYLDKSLDPLKRIEKSWYATFCLRYWRQWILLHPKYTLRDNFITSNAYMCIELNAHALITYLMVVRSQISSDQMAFLPWLLGSQVCEKTFRTARSMSSTFSSVLNFSILGLLRRLHRLQIQSVLQAQSEESKIKFPRIDRHCSKEGTNNYQNKSLTSINDNDIAEAVKKALNQAKSTMSTLGMAETLQKFKKWDCFTNNSTNDDIEDDDESDDDDHEEADICEAESNALSSTVIQEVCSADQLEIENDIKVMCKAGLVQEKVGEKLNELKSLLVPKRIESSTIPMFSYKDQSGGKSNKSKPSSKLSSKPFTPFIEVHKGEKTILIRKTTAVWLFQESERVSSDRLFRVRDKQPYSSDSAASAQTLHNTHKAPIITKPDTLEVGNLCVFKYEKSWRIGRVLQFAKYKKDTKKFSIPYKGCTANVSEENVGVLCSWYEQLSDPPNKFELLQKNIDSSYHPIATFLWLLTEELLNPVDSTVDSKEIYKESILNTDISKTFTKVLYINNECIESITTLYRDSIKTPQPIMVSSEICLTSSGKVPASNDGRQDKDTWVKYGGILLTKKDKQEILNKKELSDLHINTFQNLMKRNYPHISGLQNTLLQNTTLNSSLKRKTAITLQIIHISTSTHSGHWAALQIFENDEVHLYDSAYTSAVGDAKETIAKLIHSKKDCIKINIMNVSKQSGTVDCGLYAIATVVGLAQGNSDSVCGSVFHQDEMRPHLVNMLESGKVVPFPVVKKRRVQAKIVHVELCQIYCSCRLPDNGTTMICCDQCDKWYHSSCVGTLTTTKNWFCKECHMETVAIEDSPADH